MWNKQCSNVGQAWYGYHTGDRKKFAELEVKINDLCAVDQKKEHFVIFKSIKEVMDDMSDRSVPGPNCWWMNYEFEKSLKCIAIWWNIDWIINEIWKIFFLQGNNFKTMLKSV